MSATKPEPVRAEILSRVGGELQLRFDELPHWEGVQAEPGIRQVLPFWLGWDPIGFVRQVTPENVRNQVIRAYATDDYRFITRPPGDSAWASRLGQAKINSLERHIGSLEGLRVLEIGAGSLFVAENLLKRHGVASYVAVDPALSARSADPRLTVVRDYFPCDAVKRESFDLVLAFSCLEHAENVEKFLDALRRALAPKGCAFLTFPDIGRQFADGDLCALVHEHFSYLDRSGSSALFSAAGFDLVAVESRHDMFYCVARPSNAVAPAATVRSDAVLADAGKAFQATLADSGSRIRSEIARGMTIAFHGANAGLNNFLFLAGLNGASNVIVFDGDASKMGSFLPACPSPIRLPADGTYRDSDRVYVSATSFFDEILRTATESFGMDRRKIAPLFGASPKA